MLARSNAATKAPSFAVITELLPASPIFESGCTVYEGLSGKK